MREKLVNSQRIYGGRVINLRVDTVRMPDGREARREVVEHRGAVAIVAVDDDGDVILVEQYRRPADAVMMEIPAGTLDDAEDPLGCAKRELREETGYTAREMQPIVRFYSAPGFCTEVLHVFVARGLQTGEQATEDDESINVHKVPMAHALEMVRDGRIRDAKSIVGILAVGGCGW